MFDCTISIIISNSLDFFWHSFFKSLKVFDPYCDCSLSPNRLRFGPFIIKILLLTNALYYMAKKIKIKIKVNGKKVQLIKKTSIRSLLNKLKIPIKMVAIELNKKILDKSKIGKIYVKENDKIEIVHFIGGG